MLDDLRARGLYWRSEDPLASTEFTYSRFLAPAISEFTGLVLYCDADFLWLDDVARLVDSLQPGRGVHCVQHDHRPADATKMDGKMQTCYPRKNWSSLMLWDCSHPGVRGLTPHVVNTQTGQFLHRMQWIDDAAIGSIDPDWNWLEGWSPRPDSGVPRAVHFTRGGPWFEAWQDVEYADAWRAEHAEMLRSLAHSTPGG